MGMRPNQREIIIATGNDINEDVLLNPDYYTHKIIDKILDAPQENPNMIIIYVDMLEKTLTARKLIDEKIKTEMEATLKEQITKLRKSLKDLDKRTLMIMRFNIKFQLLLEIVFSSRPIEEAVRM